MLLVAKPALCMNRLMDFLVRATQIIDVICIDNNIVYCHVLKLSVHITLILHCKSLRYWRCTSLFFFRSTSCHSWSPTLPASYSSDGRVSSMVPVAASEVKYPSPKSYTGGGAWVGVALPLSPWWLHTPARAAAPVDGHCCLSLRLGGVHKLSVYNWMVESGRVCGLAHEDKFSCAE